MDTGFEILRFSDSNYNEITVEIQYNGEQIAQLNKDKGLHSIEIELLVDYIDPAFVPKFRLKDFMAALDTAQKLLESSSS
ncbi:MAG: hypothetical protein WBA13_01005 [Microcoleaceae cyanobacterium]